MSIAKGFSYVGFSYVLLRNATDSPPSAPPSSSGAGQVIGVDLSVGECVQARQIALPGFRERRERVGGMVNRFHNAFFRDRVEDRSTRNFTPCQISQEG